MAEEEKEKRLKYGVGKAPKVTWSGLAKMENMFLFRLPHPASDPDRSRYFFDNPDLDPQPREYTRDQIDPQKFYKALVKSCHDPFIQFDVDLSSITSDCLYSPNSYWPEGFTARHRAAPSDHPDVDVISANMAEAGVDLALEEYNYFKGTELSRKEIIPNNKARTGAGYLYFFTFKASDDKFYESCINYTSFPLTLVFKTHMRPARYPKLPCKSVVEEAPKPGG